MPRLLDTELLQDLERRWDELDTSMPSRMKPGLQDIDIDRIAAPLGFKLPEEVRHLYRWHDGSGLATMIWHRGMSSLQEAVTDTLVFREDDEEWQPGWLNIMDERPYVAVDCNVGLQDPVPVWHYGYDWPDPTRPVFASIGDMFAFWIELIDGGLMYWKREQWKISDSVSEEILGKLSGVPND